MALFEQTARVWGPFNVATDYSAVLPRWSDMHDMLIGAGLVEVTSETGRATAFDLTNFPGAEPSTGNANDQFRPAFKLYRFNDAAQATRPVFIKVEFGTYASSQGNTARYATFRFSIGQGSNGSGGLTGWVPASGILRLSANNSVTSASCSAADGAGFALCIGGGTTSWGYNIILERYRNSDGTVNADRIHFAIMSTANSLAVNGKYSSSTAGATMTQSTTANHVVLAPTGNVNTSGSLTAPGESGVGASPIYPWTFKPWPGLTSVMKHAINDVGLGVTFTLPRYGTSRTYKSLGLVAASGGMDNIANVGGGIGLLVS